MEWRPSRRLDLKNQDSGRLEGLNRCSLGSWYLGFRSDKRTNPSHMTLSNSCTPRGFASCLLRNTPSQLEMGLCAEPTGMFLPGIKIAEVDTMSLFRLNDNSVYKKRWRQAQAQTPLLLPWRHSMVPNKPESWPSMDFMGCLGENKER